MNKILSLTAVALLLALILTQDDSKVQADGFIGGGGTSSSTNGITAAQASKIANAVTNTQANVTFGTPLLITNSTANPSFILFPQNHAGAGSTNEIQSAISSGFWFLDYGGNFQSITASNITSAAGGVFTGNASGLTNVTATVIGYNPSGITVSNNAPVTLTVSGSTNTYVTLQIQNGSTNGAAETGIYLNKPGFLGDQTVSNTFGLYYNSPFYTNQITGGQSNGVGLVWGTADPSVWNDQITPTGQGTNASFAWGIGTASSPTNINLTLGTNGLALLAGQYFGNGGGLTNLNAAQLTGTITNTLATIGALPTVNGVPVLTNSAGGGNPGVFTGSTNFATGGGAFTNINNASSTTWSNLVQSASGSVGYWDSTNGSFYIGTNGIPVLSFTAAGGNFNFLQGVGIVDGSVTITPNYVLAPNFYGNLVLGTTVNQGKITSQNTTNVQIWSGNGLGTVSVIATNFQVSYVVSTNGLATGGGALVIPAAVTLPTSGTAWTNTTPVNLNCYFSGSTAYSVSLDGVAIYSSLGDDKYISLPPTNYFTVTYTVAPSCYTNRF